MFAAPQVRTTDTDVCFKCSDAINMKLNDSRSDEGRRETLVVLISMLSSVGARLHLHKTEEKRVVFVPGTTVIKTLNQILLVLLQFYTTSLLISEAASTYISIKLFVLSYYQYLDNL